MAASLITRNAPIVLLLVCHAEVARPPAVQSQMQHCGETIAAHERL